MALLRRHATALADLYRVTLITPHDGRYGGRLADRLAGRIDDESGRHAPGRDIEVIQGRAVGCQSLHQRLYLADGRSLGYDAISVNTGVMRHPSWSGINNGEGPSVWSAHSADELARFRSSLRQTDGAARVVVAGGTRQSIEAAAGVQAADTHIAGVTLLWPTRQLGRLTRRMLARLAYRGVDVVLGAPVTGHGSGLVIGNDGRRFAADHLLWAAPAVPSALARSLGMSIGDVGVPVDRYLRAPQRRSMFVTGALATLDGRRPLAGWDGDIQADVLAGNLLAKGDDDRSRRRYRAPRGELAFDLGAGRWFAPRITGISARRRLQRHYTDWTNR